MSDNYTAYITTIRTRPFAGMDRVQLGEALGYQVVVGSDVKSGDVGILFPPDGQLSDEFATQHKLTRSLGGYVSDNRRVTAQKFRDEKSEALWLSLSHLEFAGDTSSLRVGQEITSHNGVPICTRWVNPNTRAMRAQQQGKQRATQALRFEPGWFRKHTDTSNIRLATEDDCPERSVIWITEKLHGTSHREGVAPIKDRSVIARFLARFGFERITWHNVSASRNIVINELDKFYKSDFRTRAVRDWRASLHPGEVVYGEIVGYSSDNKAIQGGHDPSKVSKAFVAKFGERVDYTYGCEPGECRFYAYRIVQNTPSGVPFDLPFSSVIARCNELGIDHVPVVDMLFDMHIDQVRATYTDNLLRSSAYRDASRLSEDTPLEGFCYRIERPDGRYNVYKWKTHNFLLMEGHAQETQVDIEEVS